MANGLNGYALTQEIETEIVSAYAASMQIVPAVAAPPGWFSVGAFKLPMSLAQCRLEVIALISAAGLTGNARLYDTTAEAPVSGSDVMFDGIGTSLAYQSGIIALTGQRTYVVQAQVTGATGMEKFGVVQTANLKGP